MNTISRTISGAVSILLGLYIMSTMILDKSEDWFLVLGWGVFFIVIGIFIFFNKKEDDIEEIKK